MTYSRAVGRESPQPVEQDQFARGQFGGRDLCAMDSRGHEARNPNLHGATTGDLFHQTSPAVGDDRARDGLEQDAVLVRDLFRPSHEDPARSVHHMRFDASGDQPHDLILQDLPITAAVLVPDHEIHRQSLQPPVRMRLHQPAHEIDVLRVPDLQENDRKIARNCVAPQPGLATPVPQENAGLRAQRGIGVDDGTGEARIQLRIGLGGIDLPQRHPAVRPRQIEDAVRQVPILVFSGEAQGGIARLGDAGRDVNRRRLLRIESHPVSDRDDRVQNRALLAGQPAGIGHRLRGGDRASASDERHAVGLVGNVQRFDSVDGHQVEHPGRVLLQRTGSPRAQDGLPLRDDLRLHEEIGERRMQRVRGRRRESDFRVTRDLDRPPRPRTVGDAKSAQFDVVFRRDDDLGMRFESVVAPAKFGARFGEYRLVVRRALPRRLMRGRPELAARDVADVAERAPVVAGGVFAPAGDGEILPSAAPTARVGDHHVVAAVRQQLHFRYRRVGAAEYAYRRLWTGCRSHESRKARRGANRTRRPSECAPAATEGLP